MFCNFQIRNPQRVTEPRQVSSDHALLTIETEYYEEEPNITMPNKDFERRIEE